MNPDLPSAPFGQIPPFRSRVTCYPSSAVRLLRCWFNSLVGLPPLLFCIILGTRNYICWPKDLFRCSNLG